ncbi:PAS fold protein [Mucilaginibacter gotjawali]|uniref:PAS fold protein n=1 Tax=Mucilaginibacter gotjawali TaxID=1550579 RepID=A0A110B006_9SPHI|nr:PAS domain-containing protein [Mucilaginibacter gotjawali]BAU52217.1 PAS fold protein [Mucilaginibacter gotjawali]
MDLPGEDKAAIALANERGRSVATNNFDLELFFELTPDLLCVAGFDGYFKKINPAVSKLLGYTDEELFSAPINHFVHPEDQNITQQNREKLLRIFHC